MADSDHDLTLETLLRDLIVKQHQLEKVVAELDKRTTQIEILQAELTDLQQNLAKLELENEIITTIKPVREQTDVTEEIYELAKSYVAHERVAACSYLMERLGFSYKLALKVIKRLEKDGFVGAQKGAQPRRVIIKAESVPRPSFIQRESNSPDTFLLLDENEDELYADARAIVLQTGRATTSLLQRTLRIDYSHAIRLIDLLESRGVIGPSEADGSREILIDPDDPSFFD